MIWTKCNYSVLKVANTEDFATMLIVDGRLYTCFILNANIKNKTAQKVLIYRHDNLDIESPKRICGTHTAIKKTEEAYKFVHDWFNDLGKVLGNKK